MMCVCVIVIVIIMIIRLVILMCIYIYIVSFHSEVPDSPLAKRHGEDLGEITNHQDVSTVR